MKRVRPFLFLSCNTPWVTALAHELSKLTLVVAVSNDVWHSGRTGPVIPELQRSKDNFEWHEWHLPSGYTGRLSWVFSPMLAASVAILARKLENKTGLKPYIVAPYPYNLPWLAYSRDCPLIYYNLDDYTLYEPKKAALVSLQERQLVDRASTVLCLAKTQTESLRALSIHPERVFHFPLGVMDVCIQTDPSYQIQRNSITYIGGLTNRVNWNFVNCVVELCPDLQFYFLGAHNNNPTAAYVQRDWRHKREVCFSQPNSRILGWIPQAQVSKWCWKSAVNWIPYLESHPFVRACCPTKIMDGLASGRPLLSTAVPECLLHRDWIHIENDPENAADWLKKVASGPPEYNPQQIAYAQANNWRSRALQLCHLLGES